ncbi:solute carrier organic anion transporter family member 2B1-like [Saccostrea echinata]|uniref:solute carrier organic anion transporter family member 2B1-like n=1 Tax=Saccostrea echinata TaxID=191078 RepID=UPI002A7EFB94|nr:solute carrier organic anion transporter family member 2B1-like [Saccostrea echinata]
MVATREEDFECGIGKFRPKFLQHFANINAFVGVYSIVGMISQTLSVYVNTQVPNLERQFGLNSAQSGLVMAFNDIGFFTVVLFVSAAARFVHIPRMLFLCILLYGISGLTCSIPHFIAVSRGLLPTLNLDSVVTNATKNSDKVNLLCRPGFNVTEEECESSTEHPNKVLTAPSYSIKNLALVLIGIGMTLQGIGKAPRGPYYMVYVDDNIDRRKTGFYSGIAIASSIFGPAIAFGLGGYFSRLYITLEDVDMDTRDPRWIGAWWLGFLVFGSVSIILAFPLALFPRQLKMSKKDIAKGKVQERPIIQESSFSEKLKLSVKGYWKVVRNPVFLLTSANQIFTIMSVGGFSGFMAKFVKTHFNIPLSLANYILAGANISAVACGSFLGGIVTRKIAMTPRNVYKMILGFYILNVVFLALAMVMSCPQPTIIGPRENIPGYVDISSQNCSLDCTCQDDNFFPICGSNKVNYHSPCFAGCQELYRNGRMFSNCSCIPDGQAEAGLCESNCPYLIPWVIFIFLSSISAAMKIPPNVIAIIRSVDDRDKASAIGLNSCLVSALGWGLSPILFGKVLDGSCHIWQFPCSSSGACELYDLRSFRLSFHGLSLGMRCASLVCLICLVIWTRNWKDWKYANKTVPSDHRVDVKYTKVPTENKNTNGEQLSPNSD